jgi:hypothetical protein
MKLNFATILLILLFFSCEEKIDISLNQSEKKYLIVNGIVTNENIPKEIKLSFSVSNLNEIPENVSGAQVFISNGDTTYTLYEDISAAGLYKTDKNFIGVINKKYSLKIIYNQTEYTAETQMIPVSHFKNAKYTLDSAKNLYNISYIASNFSTTESAMFEIKLDWSNIEGYTDLPYNENHATLYFYTLKTLDVNEIFSPAKEIIYFPKGTQIFEKKYSLNTEHEKFIRSILMETEWNGGLFDVAEGNIYTNLNNGALGFFGASSVVFSNFIAE